ncbi:MAG: FkbM family methyltransferase [Deltaproteobacteria bacterium]|nr:FkbM family methyltransferase [Deltaproteobacteria bacterium]
MMSYAPVLYWKVGNMVGGVETEVRLLPALCDRDALAVDIGGNFGMYTTFMAAHAKECVVFEPLPHLASVLVRGFRGRNVRVEDVALSNGEGRATLRMPRYEMGHSTIEPQNAVDTHIKIPDTIETMTVEKRTLDSYALQPVAFLKIDVEGHEPEVLEGSEQTIRAGLPAILIELENRHRTGVVDHVFARLTQRGYSGFVFHDAHLIPVTGLHPVVRNYLFLHASKRERIRQALTQRGIFVNGQGRCV